MSKGKTSYNIKFLGIELISKSITEPPLIEGAENLGFNFLIDLKLAPEKKAVAVITTVSIILIRDNKEVGSFKTACFFELPDFETVFTKISETKYETPIQLEMLLKTVGLSTTRGIIFSEVRGTYLHQAVLPLIDIPTLIQDQRKKEVEKKG